MSMISVASSDHNTTFHFSFIWTSWRNFIFLPPSFPMSSLCLFLPLFLFPHRTCTVAPLKLHLHKCARMMWKPPVTEGLLRYLPSKGRVSFGLAPWECFSIPLLLMEVRCSEASTFYDLLPGRISIPLASWSYDNPCMSDLIILKPSGSN